MLITKAARRYASAFLQFAKEQDSIEVLLEDVHFINNTIKDSKELLVFLKSPVIKYDDKVEGLEKIFGDHVQESTRLFIKLLARKNRIPLLDQIVQAFIDQYNKYAGIIQIDVFAANALSDSQKEALHEALEKKTGKKVNMRVVIDESLKGGIAVRIDDTVIDGTIKHKLEQLEEKFLSTAVE